LAKVEIKEKAETAVASLQNAKCFISRTAQKAASDEGAGAAGD
jgi:hypothetical protein